jgi:hypothetical protein
MINHFINRHKDILEIVLAGSSGMGLMLTNIEAVLKILIGFATLGYICYKWYWTHQDRKKK